MFTCVPWHLAGFGGEIFTWNGVATFFPWENAGMVVKHGETISKMLEK